MLPFRLLNMNIFIRENRQQDRQRADYIHTEEQYSVHISLTDTLN